MRIPSLLLALSTSLAACSAPAGSVGAPVALHDFGTLNGATVELTAEGGFAAMRVQHRAWHDDRAYMITRRRLCATSCGAALDSASGALSMAAADSLFNRVLEQQRFLERDDYGSTPHAADMMTYTLVIQAEGQARTIRADDGTMPPPMRAIAEILTGTIEAARR